MPEGNLVPASAKSSPSSRTPLDVPNSVKKKLGLKTAGEVLPPKSGGVKGKGPGKGPPQMPPPTTLRGYYPQSGQRSQPWPESVRAKAEMPSMAAPPKAAMKAAPKPKPLIQRLGQAPHRRQWHTGASSTTSEADRMSLDPEELETAEVDPWAEWYHHEQEPEWPDERDYEHLEGSEPGEMFDPNDYVPDPADYENEEEQL